jgi:hypothetical protein
VEISETKIGSNFVVLTHVNNRVLQHANKHKIPPVQGGRLEETLFDNHEVLDDKVALDLIDSCNTFNLIANKFTQNNYLPFTISLSYTKYKKILLTDRDILSNAYICAVKHINQGKFKGALAKESMITCVCVLSTFLKSMEEHMDGSKEYRPIGIRGACQSAKTIVTSFLAMLLPPVAAFYTGNFNEDQHEKSFFLPIISGPNSLNICKGLFKELKTTLGIYEYIELIINGINYGSIVKLFDNNLTDIFGEDIENPRNCIIFNRNISKCKKIKSKLEKINANIAILNFVDEIHVGSGVNSVANKIKQELDLNCSDTITIGVTATPSELEGQAGWLMVDSTLNNDYSGPSYYAGGSLKKLNGDIPSTPIVKSIEDFPFPNGRYNIKDYQEDFTGRKNNKYKDIKKFYDYFKTPAERPFDKLSKNQMANLIEEHEEYKNELAIKIIHFCKETITLENNILFLRLHGNNEDCNDLRTRMERFLDNKNYDCFAYYSEIEQPEITDVEEGITVKEYLLQNYVGKNRFCLILASSGRARMGDSFPKQCATFIDFFQPDKDGVHMNTILQGTLGRACGIGKNSTCYFWEGVVKIIENYINKNSCPQKKYCGRTTLSQKIQLAKRKGKGRPSRSIGIIF